MINHHNFNFTGGIPYAAGDRYFAQDMIRDFRYHQNDLSNFSGAITGAKQNIIFWGLVVTQGAGTTFNITAGTAMIKKSITVPDNSGGWAVPTPTTTTDVYFLTEVSALTNQAVAGWTDGGPTNYLKLAYSETSQANRVRAKAAGSYDSESIPGYTLTCNTTAPTAYELEITRFTGNGAGVFTFDHSYRNKFFIGPSQRIVVASTDSPAAMIVRANLLISTAQNAAVALNTLIDSYTSAGGIIYLCEGTYNCTTSIVMKSNIILQGSGHKTTIKRNINTLQYVITCAEQTYTGYELRDFTIDGNSSVSYAGTGSAITGGTLTKSANHLYFNIRVLVGQGTTMSAFLNASRIVNCRVEGALIATDARPFSSCSNLTNCFVSVASTSPINSLFYLCTDLVGCFITSTTFDVSSTERGFNQCTRLTNCGIYSMTIPGDFTVFLGFDACIELNNCVVDTMTSNDASDTSGFNACIGVITCTASNVTNSGAGTGHGYNACFRMYGNTGTGNKTALFTGSYAGSDNTTVACPDKGTGNI